MMSSKHFISSAFLIILTALAFSSSSEAQVFRDKKTMIEKFDWKESHRLEETDEKIVGGLERDFRGGRKGLLDVLNKELKKTDSEGAKVWDELLNATVAHNARDVTLTPEAAQRARQVSSILKSYFRIKGTSAVDDLPLSVKDFEQVFFGKRSSAQKAKGENGPNQWSEKELHNLAKVLDHAARILEESNTVTMKDALRKAYKEAGLKGNIDQCFK